ncbi:MAG TPA: hypothetical protein PLP88_03805 [Bacteroidales bacterium]|nr:hypothetical protein [Bacteroidales bacterium]
MKKNPVTLALIILPAIFLVFGLTFHRTWFSGDPEYAYLLNGINIANLKSVGHTDNPGTPVQVYSAVVLRCAHFLDFSEKAELQKAVLANPDSYVELERKISIIINAIMMLILGIVSFLFLKNIWFSLILQATPFLSSNLIEHAFTKVSPEPVLIFTVAVFIIAMLAYYRSKDRNNRRYPWIFAAIAGFGLATKATFLPLVIIPFILLEGWKRKFTYLLAIIPAFVIFTAPAIPEYPHMAKWFLGLSTHTGTYGQGNAGIIDPLKYIADLGAIIVNNAALAILLFCGILVVFFSFLHGEFRKKIEEHIELKFIIAILVAQLLGILMVAKHYHANHYLIPEISLIGILVVFSLLYFKEIFRDRNARWAKSVPGVVFGVLLAGSLLNIPYLQAADHGYVITNEEYSAVMQRIDKEYPGYLKTYYYPVSINPFSALRWGSVYSRQYNLPALLSLYPKGIFYDTRINAFQLWEGEIPADELVRNYGGKILLIGGPMSPEEKQKVLAGGLSLKTLYFGRTQAIYEVDTVNSALFQGIVSSKPLWTYECNADTLTPDKTFFVENGRTWKNSWNESADAARSGTWSVKLTGENIYAMEHMIDSVAPGQQYRISAWRKGGNNKAFVVACSPEKGGFYKQSANYLSIDEKGWEQVVLNLTIPVDFKGNKLKLYLWNDSGNTVYYDDFTVARTK